MAGQLARSRRLSRLLGPDGDRRAVSLEAVLASAGQGQGSCKAESRPIIPRRSRSAGAQARSRPKRGNVSGVIRSVFQWNLYPVLSVSALVIGLFWLNYRSVIFAVVVANPSGNVAVPAGRNAKYLELLYVLENLPVVGAFNTLN